MAILTSGIKCVPPTPQPQTVKIAKAFWYWTSAKAFIANGIKTAAAATQGKPAQVGGAGRVY